MNWKFDSHSSPEYIRIVLSGTFNKEQFAAMIDNLGEQENFAAGSRLLFDDTTLELGRMSDRELLEASDAFIARNKLFAYSKVAILTTPENFAVGIKFERITEFGSRAIIEIFDNENSAVSWLRGLPSGVHPTAH
jgi:hypothetical protein